MRRKRGIARRGFMKLLARMKGNRAFRSTRKTVFTAKHATSKMRPRISTGSRQRVEADPIIRTCNLILAIAALAPAPAIAARDASSALGLYVQARIADAAGASSRATSSYAAALVADPASTPVALRAYRQAIESGNKALALRAARTLEGQRALPVDGRFLLLSESFSKGDWRNAALQIDKLEEAGTFAFMAPVLRAWTMFGAGQGDPLGALSTRAGDSLSSAYAQEHRGILLLAMKQADDGATAVTALRSAGAGSRDLDLRIAAASRLVALKRKDAALAMLAGEAPVLALAREEVNAGRPLTGAIVRPSTGLAMLLTRVANDLLRDSASPVAVTLSRLSQFSDADYQPGKLILARALGASKDVDGAVAVLNSLDKGRLSEAMARDLRFDLLLNAEKYDAALAIAKARADASGASPYDLARLGEVLARSERHSEAAAAYAKAIDAMAGPGKTNPVPWNLWLLLGREHDLAKNWAAARPALERALAMAPDEPSILNHLGYSMLENGGSIAEATALIEKASRLRPNDAAITDSLGWALFKAGRLDEAIAALERAAQNEPAVAEIGEHLGDAYWTAGRRVDARYAWNAALVQADEGDVKRLSDKIDRGLGGKP